MFESPAHTKSKLNLKAFTPGPYLLKPGPARIRLIEHPYL